ncbi:MAG: DICT sensory domain-containing protein [Elainellaceae cyanobacterium]
MLKGSILQKLGEAHHPSVGSGRPLNFGVYYKNTLVALCHALEDSILSMDCRPLVIAAFQRGKWYLQEADRYGDIADRAEKIVIMASPDTGFQEHSTSQRSNVSLVSLNEDDPVAQEWHLIISSPEYTAMVLCQELSPEDYGPAGMPDDDLERKFYGFWTFEPSLVLETTNLAIAHLEQYAPELYQSLVRHVEHISHQAQQSDESRDSPTVENIGDVASRVVDYLQTSQDDLAVDHPDQAFESTKLDNNLVSNELQTFLRIAQLMDQSDVSNPMAGAEVAALAEAMAQVLDLPAWQLHRLRLAGLLHRLAFLQGTSEILSPTTSPRYPDLDPTSPPSCPLNLGVQVLRVMPRLRAISTIITHQTEYWNGTGQPGGLAGDEIPLESRILGLIAEFQKQLAQRCPNDTGASRFDGTKHPECLDEALEACSAQSGDRWDPKLVEALTLLVNGLKQGLNLSVSMPKIAAGLWMLDSHSKDDLLQLYSGMEFTETSGSPVN